MFNSRMHGPVWLTGAAHLIIVMVAAQMESAEVWPWALLAMSGISFFAWHANYKRYRAIHDLPTSKIASAAQGYTELLGQGRLIAGSTVCSPVSARRCCWYRYTVEEKSGDKWKTVEQGSSIDHFLLVDDSGECVVSPDGAEVYTQFHKSWITGDRRYSEWLLLPGITLYAIGDFVTHNGNVPTAAEEKADISTLISEWKRDQPAMLARFDLDGNGELSLQEWELARMQAIREVRQRHLEQARGPTEGVHLLRKPRDRRLFLLANEFPDALGRRYRRWSWVHLLAFLGFGIWALILLGFS